MANVTRAESFLANFARASGMSQCGKDWLVNAVDPFHDRQTKLEGYPDTCNSASLVQRVKQSYTIKAPTGTTTPWDLQIVNTPCLNTSALFPVKSVLNGSQLPTIQSNAFVRENAFTSVINYGGLQFIAGPSGSTMDLATAATTAGYQLTSNPIPNIYQQGTVRVIANAFEVVNTTAELTVQGACSTFRQPVAEYETSTCFNLVGTDASPNAGLFNAFSGLIVPTPPTNLSQATLLPGFRTWKAKDGCYVVSALNSDTIPQQDDLFCQPILVQSPSDSGPPRLYTTIGSNTGQFLQTSGSTALLAAPDQFWTKFDQSGAYFTGLSPSTTLQVTWIVDIERFPTEQQSDLIVIATPSPRYDNIALEAYAHIMQDMPTGVMQKENGLGDWFMSAVGKVRDIVMPMLRNSAKSSPAAAALVGVHDIVTGGGGKKKRSKNVTSGLVGGAGAHFLNNGSNARDGMIRPSGKMKIKPEIKAHNKVARKNLDIYNHNQIAKKNLEIYNLEQSNKQARKNLAKYNASRGMRKRPPPVNTRLRG